MNGDKLDKQGDGRSNDSNTNHNTSTPPAIDGSDLLLMNFHNDSHWESLNEPLWSGRHIQLDLSIHPRLVHKMITESIY